MKVYLQKQTLAFVTSFYIEYRHKNKAFWIIVIFHINQDLYETIYNNPSTIASNNFEVRVLFFDLVPLSQHPAILLVQFIFLFCCFTSNMLLNTFPTFVKLYTCNNFSVKSSSKRCVFTKIVKTSICHLPKWRHR